MHESSGNFSVWFRTKTSICSYLCVCAHRCDLLMMGGEQSHERTTEEGEEETEKHQICSDTGSSGPAAPDGNTHIQCWKYRN